MTTAVCAHARCLDCGWDPDPTSKRGPDQQAEAHTKAERHATATLNIPAETCTVHRSQP